MNEREALLRAVCENPDDDTPRLVFADWLQENGEEERAEFIRAQIEQTRCELLSVPYWKCFERARRLFRIHGRTWQHEIIASPEFEWGDFVRGFSESITTLRFAHFAHFADTLFARAPLKKLRITQPVSLAELCAVPRILRLHCLIVSAELTTVNDARRFLDFTGDGPTILQLVNPIASPEVLELLSNHFGGRLFLPDGDE